MKEIILRCIALVIFVVTAYLPNNMYLLKAVGLLLLLLVLWKDDINKLLIKFRRRKDNESGK